MAHTVLLVDDDPNVLEGLKRAFRKEPYTIVTADSATSALDILTSNEVDVVISDQDMPGMSGTQFLRQVRDQYPDTVRFILTGNATLDVAIDAINEGAVSRFFTKPCSYFDLSVTIRQAIEHKDLIENAMKLLTVVKQQKALLEQLERAAPGILDEQRLTVSPQKPEGHKPASYKEVTDEISKTLE